MNKQKKLIKLKDKKEKIIEILSCDGDLFRLGLKHGLMNLLFIVLSITLSTILFYIVPNILTYILAGLSWFMPLVCAFVSPIVYYFDGTKLILEKRLNKIRRKIGKLENKIGREKVQSNLNSQVKEPVFLGVEPNEYIKGATIGSEIFFEEKENKIAPVRPSSCVMDKRDMLFPKKLVKSKDLRYTRK